MNSPLVHRVFSSASFLAIVPLAQVDSICFRHLSKRIDLTLGLQLLGFATEELSKRVGQTLAGLLNATLV